MNRSVLLRVEAEHDLSSAASWYEQQRIGLGSEFLDEALSIFRRIAEAPLIYPVVYRRARRALMRRFPFAVFFRPDRGQLVVFAVLHASRDPEHWMRRI